MIAGSSTFYDLSPEVEQIRDLAREFARSEIAPHVEANERAARFPREIVRKMGELGFFGCAIPEEFGGLGLGFLAHAIVVEEICRVHVAFGTCFNTQALSVPMTLIEWGSPALVERYVRPMVSGELIGFHAITEPSAGSDVASIQTRAIRRGDTYYLTGTKMWITHGTVADAGIVFAKTEPELRHRGLTAFMVRTDSPGLTRAVVPANTGSACAPASELVFDECPVPADHRIGPENEGFKICMQMLERTRITIAARAVGVAQACLDASLAYARERETFGKKIGEYQMVQQSLADMLTEVEAARLLVYRAAFLRDRGRPAAREASMAKLFASEALFRAAAAAQFLHGGYGLSPEWAVSRYLNEAQFLRLAEGTSSIHRQLLARDALGWRPMNRDH